MLGLMLYEQLMFMDEDKLLEVTPADGGPIGEAYEEEYSPEFMPIPMPIDCPMEARCAWWAS